jgi:amino acid adenylation domain-containing protein
MIPNNAERHKPFPLTELQQAYWVGEHSGFELGKVVAHRYVEYEIDNCDIPRLERAWQSVVARHDMLRAVILPNGWQQILVDVPDYRIEVNDLRGQVSDIATSQLEATRVRMSNQAPGSDQWPLFELSASIFDGGSARIHLSTNLIIHDGLSLKIILDDLHRFYEQADYVPTPFKLSFRDYRQAIENISKSERYQRDLAYWHDRIATLPPAPELPLEKNSDSLNNVYFKRWHDRLETDLWHKLKARAFKAGLTPSSLLCAAYAEILAVWSKNPNFTLNFLVGNRARLHPEVANMVGPFSNTLLLEVDCTQPGSFETRAQRLQEQLVSDLSHSAVSGVQVIRDAAHLQGWASRALMPIVFANVIFSEMGTKESSSITWNKVYHAVQTPQVYMDHQVREEDEELVLNWDCVPALFPDGLLDDMFDAYIGFVRRLAIDEGAWQEEDTANTLIPRAHLELQDTMNATETTISEEMLHTLFTRQVAQRSAHIAVIDTRLRLSYADLDRRSNQVAHWLRNVGVRPNQLIAVAMEKGWEQVVAVLGVLKAGAAYLPIDPSYPKERIANLINDSADIEQQHIVLTQSWLDDDTRWSKDVRRLCIDGTELEAEGDEPLENAQRPSDLAYVIYTSGSTGRPKGIMIDHRGAVNTVLDINRRFEVGSDDRTFALSSLSFDLSVYDIFGILAAGGAVVIPEPARLRDPGHWAKLLSREHVTLWNSVPALMAMLIESQMNLQEHPIDTLRQVWLSGDWIPVTLPGRIKTVLPMVKIVSLGGATEASIWSIAYPIEDVNSTRKSIPYGRPLGNQRFYVLNWNLERCPVWVPGELYISGIGLAKGYRDDKDKTHAAFFKHPKTGEALYRTGDWGRYMPDGNLEFLGREDTQVKVRGFRIELGEIESTLRYHPAVAEVVVTAQPDGGAPEGGINRSLVGAPEAEKILVAYVVPDNPQTPVAAGVLRDFVAKQLPEYLVPAAFIVLEALPLSSNGKINRNNLPAFDALGKSKKTYVEPRDELEYELVRIWEEVLAVQSVGVKDNFFELGGHSLLGLRMLARVEEACGKHLPLSSLFNGGTIEQLCTLVRSTENTQSTSSLVVLQANGSEYALTCVHPSGGNVLCYSELSRQLGSKQPCYGLQSNFQRKAPQSIEAMATQYIKALQAVQHQGPYRLCGWSFGGIVAYEMSCQLQAQGEDVASLVLIDSWIPSIIGTRSKASDIELLATFFRDLGGWRVEGNQMTEKAIGFFDPEEQLRLCLESLQAVEAVSTELTVSQIRPLLHTFKRNIRAAESYMPKPYYGRTLLIRTSEQIFEDFPDPARNPDYGWDTLVRKQIKIAELPANHYTLLTAPNVSKLALILQRFLDEPTI